MGKIDQRARGGAIQADKSFQNVFKPTEQFQKSAKSERVRVHRVPNCERKTTIFSSPFMYLHAFLAENALKENFPSPNPEF